MLCFYRDGTSVASVGSVGSVARAHHCISSQTGRHRPPQGTQQGDKPYGKPTRGTARRGGRGGVSNAGRVPAGTPPGITAIRQAPSKAEKDHAKSELSRKLSSAEMKAWLESRMIAEGVLDMSVSIQAAMRENADMGSSRIYQTTSGSNQMESSRRDIPMRRPLLA